MPKQDLSTTSVPDKIIDLINAKGYTGGDNEVRQLIESYGNHRELEGQKPFYDVFHIKGSHPDYHDMQVDRLKREWPVLYRLLSELPRPQQKETQDD